MVGKYDLLHQLLDQDPALLLVCSLPDRFHVQLPKQGSNSLETSLRSLRERSADDSSATWFRTASMAAARRFSSSSNRSGPIRSS
jgi:hypothetical protein